MIELRDLCKTFVLKGRRQMVADNINVVFPDQRVVGILGRNGAGKSSLLKMLAGTMSPDSGEVRTTGHISWPVGFAGSFHPELSGLQNTYFIARVYGVDTEELADFVADFAELGQHFRLPIRTYSSGMKSRLAFGVSMGIRFDTYLVDEVTAVGDARFKKKSEELFVQRMSESAAVMVTHSMAQVKRLCNQVGVLHHGRLKLFDDPEEGIAFHHQIMETGP